MIRTLLKEVKEYKAASIATPFFMILEVLFETFDSISDGIYYR